MELGLIMHVHTLENRENCNAIKPGNEARRTVHDLFKVTTLYSWRIGRLVQSASSHLQLYVTQLHKA